MQETVPLMSFCCPYKFFKHAQSFTLELPNKANACSKFEKKPLKIDMLHAFKVFN